MFFLIALHMNFPVELPRAFIRQPKATVDQPTYLVVYMYPFSQRMAKGGYAIIVVNALKPGGEIDTLYSGGARIHVIEQNPDNSISPLPEVVSISSGAGFGMIAAGEIELAGVYATDTAGVMKPSFVYPFFVDTSSTSWSPSRLKIEGPTRINASEEIPGVFDVLLLGSDGHIYSNYPFPPELDTTSVMVTVLDDDSSAWVSSIMGTGTSIVVPIIGGMGNVLVYDTESESIRIVAYDVGTGYNLAPDTFTIEVVPMDEPATFVLYPFTGYYGNVGYPKYALGMVMGENGPNINATTQEVKFTGYDFMGTSSFSVSPSDWTSFIGGAVSMVSSDTEPDSCTFIEISLRGTPEIFPVLSAKYYTQAFRDTGEATFLKVLIPSTGVVGDTIPVEFFAVDAWENVDTTYEGFAYLFPNNDSNNTVSIIDSLGDTISFVHLVNGEATVYLVDTEPETLEMLFGDAEHALFFAYLGLRSFEGIKEIAFVNPGDTAVAWDVDAGSPLITGIKYMGTVKAVDDSGMVDVSFNDTAIIHVTGNCILSDTLVPVVDGIGTFTFMDTTEENVWLKVGGAGLNPDSIELNFRSEDAGVFTAVVTDMNECLVNDTVHFLIYTLTSNLALDTTFTGYDSLVIEEGNPNGSVYGINTDLSSIPIVQGLGEGYLSSSEIEAVEISAVDENGMLSPLTMSHIDFKGELVWEILGNHLINIPDTIVFYVRDAYGNLLDHTGDSVYLSITEKGGSEPNSWTLDPSPVPLVNGVGKTELVDTEPETLTVSYYADESRFKYSPWPEELVYMGKGNALTWSLSVPAIITDKGVITFSIPVKRRVKIKVIDAAGRVAQTPVDRVLPPGVYQVKMKSAPPGVYFIRMEAGKFTKTEKVVWIR